MNRDISKEQEILDRFNGALSDGVTVSARWRRRITRHDGTVEETVIPKNIVTAAGLNALAALGVGAGTGANSAAAYLAVGTVSAAHSLGSLVTHFGEVSRKVPVTKTTSKMTMIVAMTWGGAADGLTGVALASGAIVNHANSGQGTAFNLTNSVNATLQASDFLFLQCEISVGSHNL